MLVARPFRAQVDIGEDEPIIEIPIDPFLDTVMTTWISMQNEGRKELDATFEKYDENGDGMLSLEEFTSTHAAFLLLVPGCASCSCVVMRACADPGLLPMPHHHPPIHRTPFRFPRVRDISRQRPTCVTTLVVRCC